MAQSILWAGASDNGSADGSSFANRIALFESGDLNTDITGHDFTSSGLTVIVEGAQSYTMPTDLNDSSFTNAPTQNNPLIFKSCDAAGNENLPEQNGDWHATDDQCFDCSNFPTLTWTGDDRFQITWAFLESWVLDNSAGTIVYNALAQCAGARWCKAICGWVSTSSGIFTGSSGDDQATFRNLWIEITSDASGDWDKAVGVSGGRPAGFGNIRVVNNGTGTGGLQQALSFTDYDANINMTVPDICVVGCKVGVYIETQRDFGNTFIERGTFADCDTGIELHVDPDPVVTDSEFLIAGCVFDNCTDGLLNSGATPSGQVARVTLHNNLFNSCTTDIDTTNLEIVDFDGTGTHNTTGSESTTQLFVDYSGGNYRISRASAFHNKGFGCSQNWGLPADKITNGLVAHYSASRDDDGAGTTTATDLSGNSHDGTQNGGLTEIADVAWNGVRAWEFDGVGDYIEVTDHADFTFGDGSSDNPFSVSFCINPNDDHNASSGTPIGKGPVGTGGEWSVTFYQNEIWFRMIDSSANATIGRSANYTFELGYWYQVTLIYDGSGTNAGAKIYINGTEAAAYTNQNTGTYVAMEDTSATVKIGQRNSDSYFDGLLDSIRIYNRILTTEEIQALAAGRIGRDELTDQNWEDFREALIQNMSATCWNHTYSEWNERVVGDEWDYDGTVTVNDTPGTVERAALAVTSSTSGRLYQVSATKTNDLSPGSGNYYEEVWISIPSSEQGSQLGIFEFASEKRLYIDSSDNVIFGVHDGTSWTDTPTGATFIFDQLNCIQVWVDHDAQEIYLSLNGADAVSSAYTFGSINDAGGNEWYGRLSAGSVIGEYTLELVRIGTVIPNESNRAWLYNNGDGRDYVEVLKRQLRTPITQTVSGGSSANLSFGSRMRIL